MQVTLRLGAVVFRIDLERNIELDEELIPFLADEAEHADVSVSVRWDWDPSKIPDTACLGRDSLLRYFARPDGRCAMAIADSTVYQARTEYTANCSHMRCYINEARCHPVRMNVGTVLRFLPMREVFHRFGVLFFHASQVVYRGKGILFTAPSGMGKTTQAKLWRDSRGAEIRCNDRTLIRKQGNKWLTYGYPLDGSEPVRSNRSSPLGCIVFLKQGKKNEIERLSPAKAVAHLMEQLVMDAWNGDATAKAAELLLDIWCEAPVYRLTCTPDSDAVACLEKKLMEDGVL